MSTLREKLADVQHGIWSHWMKYMFSCGTLNDDGTWTMPADKFKRWHRQMHTPYSDLSDREQESDRHQADKTLVEIGESSVSNTLSESLRALQRHHDFYVNLERKGELNETDRDQLATAMRRETERIVLPLA